MEIFIIQKSLIRLKKSVISDNDF